MNRVLLGAALLFLSTQAAWADESCKTTFKQEGSVATGLHFFGQSTLPAGVSAQSALDQFRVAATKEDFLMGQQTGHTLVFQQPASKKARAFNSQIRVTSDGKLAVDVPLPSGMSAPTKAVAKVMCDMMAEVQAGPQGDALAAQGRAIPAKAIVLADTSADNEVKQSPPKLTNQRGDWWNIHGRGSRPERELIYADASSLKALDADTLELTGMRLYESAESDVDYNVYTFHVRCAADQVRIEELYLTMRDGMTFKKIEPIDYVSSQNNWLSKVQTFACEPAKREKKRNAMIHIGPSVLEGIIKATWEVWWEDGTRPKVEKRTTAEVSASQAVSAKDVAKSFEGEE